MTRRAAQQLGTKGATHTATAGGGTYIHRYLDPALLSRVNTLTPDVITTSLENIELGKRHIQYKVIVEEEVEQLGGGEGSKGMVARYREGG